jgi:NAD(P)-dependent dehydrogenase (short-subunit alcohol dehydrogenase family)
MIEVEKMELGNRLALVTGAGRGLGAAIAHGLAKAGARVILADIAPDEAQKAAQSIAGEGFHAFGEQLDITDRKALDVFAAHVAQTYGELSILVNNAGVAGMARLGDAESADTWDRNIAVNLTGAFDTTRAFLPALKATRGTVINVSSVVAFTSGFAHVGYTASKGGIRSLTQAMCRELAPFGIRVNAVAPGYIDTAMGGKGDGTTDDWLRWHCPLGRFGEPREVAGPVVFLASDQASFVNGVTLPIDGGYLVV